MAACSFDLQFQYVAVGWEGSTGDMKVLRWALHRGGFSISEGKYYLVDSGYANTHQFVAPCRGNRTQGNDMFFNMIEDEIEDAGSKEVEEGIPSVIEDI
ncbi:hypothetical protein QJS10_CPB22g00220 [Acorus calamus]|uniref:DDE Tnp4 domain-containing protein n=1 Tax=Acorus calamus TaxID=4465 RepID=A0AAV9C047_ACOCL|nr:hypothetical protein QJS10_CPB22g00220 [Acorus calamus]